MYSKLIYIVWSGCDSPCIFRNVSQNISLLISIPRRSCLIHDPQDCYCRKCDKEFAYSSHVCTFFGFSRPIALSFKNLWQKFFLKDVTLKFEMSFILIKWKKVISFLQYTLLKKKFNQCNDAKYETFFNIAAFYPSQKCTSFLLWYTQRIVKT